MNFLTCIAIYTLSWVSEGA